jgi:hypothetical protein
LHAQALLDLEARWARLRKGARPLATNDIQLVAKDFGAFYVSYFGGSGSTGAGASASPWKCKALDEAEPARWIAEPRVALAAYTEALAIDPKVGVKRRADQLRKAVPT